jgi:hypothetical protein
VQVIGICAQELGGTHSHADFGYFELWNDGPLIPRVPPHFFPLGSIPTYKKHRFFYDNNPTADTLGH